MKTWDLVCTCLAAIIMASAGCGGKVTSEKTGTTAAPQAPRKLLRTEVPSLDNAHPKGVTALAYSEDGALLATAGEVIKIWSHPSHRLVATLAGHTGGTMRVAFSPDGSLLASTGLDQTMRLWSLEEQRELGNAPTAAPVTLALDFDSSGTHLAFASPKGGATVWQLASARELCHTDGTDIVTSVGFSRTTTHFIAADASATARAYEVGDCASLAVVPNQRPAGANAFRYSADGKHAAIGTMAGVRVWSTDKNAAEAFVPLRGKLRVVANLAFRSAERLAFATLTPRDGSASAEDLRATIEVWQRAASGGYQRVMTLPGGIAVDIHPSTGVVATGIGTRIAFHPFPTLHSPPAELEVQTGHKSAIRSMAVAPEGDRLLTADETGTAVLWDLRSGRQLYRFPDSTQHVSFADSGRLAIAAGADIRVWDVATSRLLNVFTASSTQAIHQLDGQAAGPYVTLTLQDGTLARFHLLTGAPLAQTTALGLPSALAASRKGDTIARTRLGTLEVMNFKDKGGAEIPIGNDNMMLMNALALSDDGARVAAILGRTTDKQRIEVFDAKSGDSIFSVPTVMNFESLAFTRSGEQLIASGGNLAVWDVASAKKLSAVEGSYVLQKGQWARGKVVLTLPNRDLAITGDTDGAITLWELPTLRRIRSMRSAARPVQAIAMSPNGTVMAGVDARGNVYRWEVGAADFLTRVRGPKAGILGKRHGAATWHPDQPRLALGGVRSVDVVSPTTGDLIETLSAPAGDNSQAGVLHSLSYSADGSRLMGASSDSMSVWSPSVKSEPLSSANATSLGLGQGHSILAAALAPAGDTALIGSGQFFAIRQEPGALIVWDVETGQTRKLGQHAAGVVAVDIAPDGAMAASASRDGVVALWDLQAGTQVATLTAPGVQVLRFSPDGTRLATGGLLGPVLIWDVAKRETVGELATSSWVTDLRFTAAGDRLWIAERDGRVTVSDVRNVERLVDLVITGEGGFIAYTPRGDYWASPNALPAVAFRVAGRAMSFDQLDLFYNRPDVVMEALGFRDQRLVSLYREVRAQRRRKMGVSAKQELDFSKLPELRVTETLPVSTGTSSLAIAAEASSKSSTLERLNVWVNGVPVYGQAGLKLSATEDDGTRWRGKLDLPLVHGDNRIEVSVTDARGLESLRDAFSVTRRGSAEAPDLYVLTVGVSDYGDEKYDLRYAAKDARDLARMFVDTGHQYRQVKVETITDKDATRQAILERGTRLLASARPHDAVVVFLAGHGVRDSSHLYHYATRDVNMLKPEGTGLTFADIESLVGGAASRRKLVLIDSCFAGELVEGDPPKASRESRDGVKVVGRTRGLIRTSERQLPRVVNHRALELGFADLRRGTGSGVIASSAGLEFAFESDDWSNGAFTYSVIEGIRKRLADADASGEITVSELRDYVGSRVRELTGGRQTPVARRHNPREDFSLNQELAPILTRNADGASTWTYAAVGPEGKRAAVARDGWVANMRLSDGVILAEQRLPAGAIRQLEFTADGTQIAIAGEGVAQLWNLEEKSLRSFGTASPYGSVLRLSPSGKHLATNDGNSPMRTAVFDTHSGKKLQVFAGNPDALAFVSEDLLVAYESGSFARWDLATGKKTPQANQAKLPPSGFSLGGVLSADGSRVAVQQDKVIRVWEVASGKLLMQVATNKTWYSLAFSGRGQLAGSADDGTLQVWRVETGESTLWLTTADRFGRRSHRLSFSRNGRVLLGSGAGTIRAWEL